MVDELNVTLPALVPNKQLTLELLKWETTVTPGLGRDAQDVVNRQIGDYDIFVGILWKRMGTPTAVASSGTEEEYRRAYLVWEKDKKLPILFYFSQEPYLIKTAEEASQLQKVMAFRQELSGHGLVWDYPGPSGFADAIRRHLALVVADKFLKGSTQEAVESVQRLSPSQDQAVTRSQLEALAKEYVELRQTLPAGTERTRLMSIIAAQMRTFATSGHEMLPDLVVSSSAGDRLAAVCILQQICETRYLYWLAERVATEQPFIGYHATVALSRAIRSPLNMPAPTLAAVLQSAREFLSERTYQDPNQDTVLKNAEKELSARDVS